MLLFKCKKRGFSSSFCKFRELLGKPGKSEKSPGFGVRRSGFSFGLFLRLAMGQDGLPLKNFQAFRHFEYGRSNYVFLYKGNRLTPRGHLMSWSYDTGTPTAGHRVSKTCRMPCGPGRWPQNLSYDFPGDSQTLLWRGSQAPFQSQVRKIMLCGRIETGRSMVCPEINQQTSPWTWIPE